MSLHRTLGRTSAVSNPAYTRPFLPFLYPGLSNSEPHRRSFSKNPLTSPPRLPRSTKSMDSFFIHALARAASCPEHAPEISPPKTPWLRMTREARRQQSTSTKTERHEQMQQAKKKARPKKETHESHSPTSRRPFSEEQLKALVDYYGPGFEEQPEDVGEDNGPGVWTVGDSHIPRPLENQEDKDTFARLQELLKDETACHTQVYDAYKQLPAPGVAYMPSKTIHQMLHHLSVLDRPTPVAMQRFLSILDDMADVNIPVNRTEWTTAIYLSGRFVGNVTSDMVQRALRLWRQMETRAGIRGGRVTLNVLFDIAVRAGRFRLAEMFLRELEVRRIRYDRHFRVSLIYYHGVKQNSDAIRRTYFDLVTAGEPVDTVVLNAVIAALLRSGEPSAADHVFERMKRLDATKTKTFFTLDRPLQFNLRIWRGRRAVGQHLTRRTRELQRKDAPEDAAEELQNLQDVATVAPNSRTYSLLIRHAAHVTGDLDRIVTLLREMGYNGVPVEGTTFIVIFHGFNNFGGGRNPAWTRARLEQTWQEYLQAVEQKLERTWISRLAVIAALHAFKKCGADADRLRRVWEEAKVLWTDPAEEEEREAVARFLSATVRKMEGE